MIFQGRLLLGDRVWIGEKMMILWEQKAQKPPQIIDRSGLLTGSLQ